MLATPGRPVEGLVWRGGEIVGVRVPNRSIAVCDVIERGVELFVLAGPAAPGKRF
jgi:hypothetical protein